MSVLPERLTVLFGTICFLCRKGESTVTLNKERSTCDVVAFIRKHVYKPEYANEEAGLTAAA